LYDAPLAFRERDIWDRNDARGNGGERGWPEQQLIILKPALKNKKDVPLFLVSGKLAVVRIQGSRESPRRVGPISNTGSGEETRGFGSTKGDSERPLQRIAGCQGSFTKTHGEKSPNGAPPLTQIAMNKTNRERAEGADRFRLV